MKVRITNDESREPSILSDERFVEFYSGFNNLVSGDANGHWDVFLHDRKNNQTHLISVSSAGFQVTDNSHNPSISGDGRFISFSSYADNLVEGNTNEPNDIFVRDRIGYSNFFLPIIIK